jgi:hypothetical protein
VRPPTPQLRDPLVRSAARLPLYAIKLERRATEAIKLGLPDLPEVEKPAE